jgi:uncharacterized repeat protein (TIGR03803 family)
MLLTPAWAVERQALTGHVSEAVQRLQPAGRLPGSNRLNLAIGLPLRNQQALTTLLEQLYDPASPQYRDYLTPEQFTKRFGPRKEDYWTLIDFAKSKGLTVTATHPNRTLLDVSGSVEDIEVAFHVRMQLYQHPSEARTFHAPDVEPSIDLAVPVLHISGLNNFHLLRPMVHRVPLDANRKRKSLVGSAPGGSFMGNDFRAAYVPGVALTGAGQSVALFEGGGYYPSDITDYESLAGLPNVPLQNVWMNGFDGTPDSYSDFEVSLDIEMAISMAPGLSRVIVYGGPNSYYDDILNRIATDNAARQISSSWTISPTATTEQIFKQYAAQGQSFFEASGDDGPSPSAWVADDPYITSVGGTELSTSGPEGAWVCETVWNSGYDLRQGSSQASGGGISPTYSIPGWQQGLSVAANHGSMTRRNSPDVAMVADNIWVLSDNGNSSAGEGTSASAPLWAGFSALVNQLAEAHGRPPVGFINPAIYALGKGAKYSSMFHDITIGNNTTVASPTNYFAVPGYDLCTGWGTPNGSNLLYALALPQVLQITPDTNFSASGAPGGPFSPTAQNYSLANSGASSLNWALGYTVSWLDASATSGSIAAGGSAATITLSLNPTANSFPAGSHTAELWFTNLNDGSVQGRLFTLAVVTSPTITTGLVNQTVPEGGIATFTVVPASTALPTYSWTRDQLPLADDGRISGSATSTLTISNVSSADAGTYTVYIQNALGLSSSDANLLVVPSPPVIVVPPTNQTALPGATALFAVGAVGTQPLFYQWQNHGTNISSGGDTSVLTLRDVSPADAGTYAVVVSNTLGSVTNTGGTLAVIPITLPGATLATLYSFKDANDGANPLAALVQATNGSFYGTAFSGGAYGTGTLFRITTNGALTILHAFSGGNDGGAPRAGLIQAVDGNLYGTTSSGGLSGGGTVFRTTLGGGLTTLHAFSAGTEGSNPWGLVQATDGNFYGTTARGGTSGDGTVFKMLPSGALTVLHGFSGADGANPRGGLVQGNDGNLYGVTLMYGSPSPYDGTVFRISTTGTLTSLFNGTGTNRFSPRDRLVQRSDGNFYSTTLDDGANRSGTIFRVTPSGLLTRLYSFTTGSDGQWPRAALVEGKDGYFYGTTTMGAAYGSGTVFRLAPNGTFTTLVQFDGFNGANPASPLAQATDGNFYSTTPNGGAYGFGTVFRLSVPAPTLSIALSSSNVVLSWPSWATDLVLHQTSDLATGNWMAVTNSPIVVNQQNEVTLLPPAGGNTFYRLIH